MSEAEAKEELVRLGTLPGVPPGTSRVCYKSSCTGKMKLKTWSDREAVLRCDIRSCGQHFNAIRAYTPLFGAKTTYKEYLMMLFCFSLQLRIDQTVLITGIPEDRVAFNFHCFRDVYAWMMWHMSQGVVFAAGEVDLDASKCHVDRSSKPGEAVHKGRIFLQKERGSKRRRIAYLADVTVKKGDALPPESNEDIQEAIVASMQDGSIAAGDGGQAIRSSVRKAAGGRVPLATALHGRKPKKQFTRLQKIAREKLSPKQGRLNPASSTLRITGGNQGAEGAWGSGKQGLKQRAVHRGKAMLHSSAHAGSTLYLSHHPGLENAGRAWKAFLCQYVDKVSPHGFFTQKGWPMFTKVCVQVRDQA